MVAIGRIWQTISYTSQQDYNQAFEALIIYTNPIFYHHPHCAAHTGADDLPIYFHI